MAFTSLNSRIDDLPLVICGPILRAVGPNSVTVWVALKEKRQVWLRVHEYKELSPFPNLRNTLTTVLEGDGTTISVGEHLHIVTVTAKVKNNVATLSAGKLYFYNLFFTEADNPPVSVSLADINLATPGTTAPIDFIIHYEHEPKNPDPGHVNHIHLPSFSLPPDDLNALRIVHGSCRKSNAEGLDAMPAIDQMISPHWKNPSARPHYLFLTGDQIYADDVSTILLSMLIDAEKALMGTKKNEKFFLGLELDKELEIDDKSKTHQVVVADGKTIWTGQLPPQGKRAPLIKHFAKFSDDSFHNHLISFGEYCAMYLFVWSDTLWHRETLGNGAPITQFMIPEFEDVYPGETKANTATFLDGDVQLPSKNFKKYNKEKALLLKFRSTLPNVRRALANVPTYMIFDDHDVTDDWHMTLDWCKGVFSNILGRRIIQNGMLAYTLFQGWGNTPARFDSTFKNKSGSKLLTLLSQWDVQFGHFTSDESKITEPLGLPGLISSEVDFLFQKVPNHKNLMLQTTDKSQIMEWHYTVEGKNFEILVLDGRTKRGYPNLEKSKDAEKAELEKLHADILHEVVFSLQMPPPQAVKDITFIVAPTSILSIPAIDFDELPFISEKVGKCKTDDDPLVDFYDHWKNQSAGFEKLLSHLANRGKKVDATFKTKNIILTGDVHFAAASRMIYEKVPPSQNNDKPHSQSVFVQLVSSSLKKQEKKTRLLHYKGYRFSDPAAFVRMRVFLDEFPDAIIGFIEGNKYATALLGWSVPIIFLTLVAFHVLAYIAEKIFDLLSFIDPFDFFEPKLPASRQYFGWANPSAFGQNVDSINIRIPHPDPNKISFENRLLTSPTMLTKSDAKKVENFQLPDPHWRYKIDYLLAENEARIDYTDGPNSVSNPGVVSKDKALEAYLKAAKNHSDYIRKHGSGKEIVGLNNVSECSFDWKEEEKSVIQKTWWYLERKDKQKPEQFFPLTKFKVSLDFNKDALPSLIG